MPGKICYIDLDAAKILNPAQYQMPYNVYESIKESDFVVFRGIYSDTSRSIKLCDSCVMSIANLDAELVGGARGIITFGVSASFSNTYKATFIRGEIRKDGIINFYPEIPS